MIFSLENTTDQELVIYSEYLTIDGTEYSEAWDEDTQKETGGVYLDIAPGSTRQVQFLVELDNMDISELSGQFLVCEFETGRNIGIISF